MPIRATMSLASVIEAGARDRHRPRLLLTLYMTGGFDGAAPLTERQRRPDSTFPDALTAALWSSKLRKSKKLEDVPHCSIGAGRPALSAAARCRKRRCARCWIRDWSMPRPSTSTSPSRSAKWRRRDCGALTSQMHAVPGPSKWLLQSLRAARRARWCLVQRHSLMTSRRRNAPPSPRRARWPAWCPDRREDQSRRWPVPAAHLSGRRGGGKSPALGSDGLAISFRFTPVEELRWL